MSELKQFRLPDVGEGLTEADIVKWHVQPGDSVAINQIIVEIETAKAVVELPSPYQGVVAGLLVPEGATADVGSPIISVEVGPDAGDDVAAGSGGGAAAGSGGAAVAGSGGGVAADVGGAAVAGSGGGQGTAAGTGPLSEDLIPAPPAEGAVEPGMHGSPAPKEERQAVLVGYGVKLGSTTRRPRKRAAASGPAGSARASAGPARGPSVPAPSVSSGSPSVSAPSVSSGSPAALAPTTATGPAPAADVGARVAVLAKPPVRKLAKDLGIDLSRLAGTGPNGSITRDDVQAAARAQPAGGHLALAVATAREERVAVRGVRKHTAAAVVGSAFTAPHVTEFLQIDMTETMALTARVKTLPEFAGLRVSPLLFVAKALIVAVARHPMANSSWDEAAQEIVVKHYVNLGIAAATDRGLVVPNVKDAHLLSLPALARALSGLADTARSGKATPADLAGGTITITNVGVFGVDTGTPILTPGEAAILAFGQVKDAPWVHEGELSVRKVTTLALSFDHRIVDGDLGSAVLRDVGSMLEDPLRMLVWA
jgi:2-oxoisovalerate dehydrogenase E2 component (dihydrolipoyl transacylase)